MAGLIGAGRTELCRAIFGVDPRRFRATSSSRQARVAIRSPRDAVARRHRAGHRGPADAPAWRCACPSRYNVTLANVGAHQPLRACWIAARRTASRRRNTSTRLRIKAASSGSSWRDG